MTKNPSDRPGSLITPLADATGRAEPLPGWSAALASGRSRLARVRAVADNPDRMSVFISEERLSDAGGLPVGPCPTCEREVVAYLVDSDEGPIHACVHCDRPLRRVDWIDEREVVRLGYDVRDPLAAGCATGCASGGCAARGRAPEGPAETSAGEAAQARPSWRRPS